ncbi:MAG: hypothetical protein JW732_09790 [Dehalococcoidia bacterium]|nr:hypothetical protein [Dehalococcoidia bacterium]
MPVIAIMAQAISETMERCATKVFAFPRLFSIPPAGSPMDFVWLPHDDCSSLTVPRRAAKIICALVRYSRNLEAIEAYRKEWYV